MNKPKASDELILSKLELACKDFPENKGMFLISVRGYYFKTMGNPTKNDRGLYDDAVFVFGPSGMKAFNFNVDPSQYKQGVASLIANKVYWFKKGLHGLSKKNPYPAFRPATSDETSEVTRDGIKNPKKGVAINIHRGGSVGTSSLGCQTVPPTQWDEFYKYVSSEMKKAEVDKFPYLILTGPVN